MPQLNTILIIGVVVLLLLASFVYLVRELLKGVRRTSAFFSAPPIPKETEQPGDAFIESKAGQRLFALLLLGCGGFGTYWIWREALQGNGARPGYGYFFAAIVVLGLNCLLFPLDFELQRWKYNRSRPRTWAELPATMKCACVVAVLVGLGNYLLLAMR
jgi:hypothetical protein